ncbi:hypothetical protein GBAR_LOCUS31417, partial [Geodia barretti]
MKRMSSLQKRTVLTPTKSSRDCSRARNQAQSTSGERALAHSEVLSDPSTVANRELQYRQSPH